MKNTKKTNTMRSANDLPTPVLSVNDDRQVSEDACPDTQTITHPHTLLPLQLMKCRTLRACCSGEGSCSNTALAAAATARDARDRADILRRAVSEAQARSSSLLRALLAAAFSGRLTGRYAGGDRGAHKVADIRARYDLSRYTRIHAYGDSSEDRAMLALAHERWWRGQRVA